MLFTKLETKKTAVHRRSLILKWWMTVFLVIYKDILYVFRLVSVYELGVRWRWRLSRCRIRAASVTRRSVPLSRTTGPWFLMHFHNTFTRGFSVAVSYTPLTERNPARRVTQNSWLTTVNSHGALWAEDNGRDRWNNKAA